MLKTPSAHQIGSYTNCRHNANMKCITSNMKCISNENLICNIFMLLTSQQHAMAKDAGSIGDLWIKLNKMSFNSITAQVWIPFPILLRYLLMWLFAHLQSWVHRKYSLIIGLRYGRCTWSPESDSPSILYQFEAAVGSFSGRISGNGHT